MTVKAGISAECWYTVPIPSSSATRGDEIVVPFPSIRIVPESGRIRPERIPISVDLPAPFSPSRQCTSPRRRVRLTRSLASTPGNALEISASSTIGVSLLAFTVSAQCAREERAARGTPIAAGGRTWSLPYCSSFWTSPALCVTGIWIFPAMIFACAALICAQTAAGMYFERSSETPPFLRLRL